MSEPSAAPLPLVVLGGYLGAGKTTLIHRLLTGDGELRCGVLVNDFGEVNIDQKLIANQNGETVALTNGCACCSIQNDLAAAIERLLEITDELDLILVEASGVAHPDKIAAIGDSWPGLSQGVIVVAVDVTDLERLQGDKFVGALVRRQIEVADHLVLTKTDIADPSQVESSREAVRASRPGASTNFLDSLDSRQMRALMVAGERTPRPEFTHIETVAAESGFWSRTVRGLDAAPSRAALGVLLSEMPSDIERIKGFVNCDDGHRYLVQGTASGSTVTGSKGSGTTELLVIGAGDSPRSGDRTHDWIERLERTLAGHLEDSIVGTDQLGRSGPDLP